MRSQWTWLDIFFFSTDTNVYLRCFFSLSFRLFGSNVQRSVPESRSTTHQPALSHVSPSVSAACIMWNEFSSSFYDNLFEMNLVSSKVLLNYYAMAFFSLSRMFVGNIYLLSFLSRKLIFEYIRCGDIPAGASSYISHDISRYFYLHIYFSS